MAEMKTNFFELSLNPPVLQLFVTENYRQEDLNSPENVATFLTKNSIVSLFPFDHSKKIPVNPRYLEWLLKKLLFGAFDTSKSMFDPDYKKSEISILDQILTQREEYSVIRRLVVQIFHAQGRPLLAFDPITKVYNRLSLAKLLKTQHFSRNDFMQHSDCLAFVDYKGERRWTRGRITEVADNDAVKVEIPLLFDGTIEMSPARVIPSLSRESLSRIVKAFHRPYDFDSEVKQLGEFTSKSKLEAILQIFENYLRVIFPLKAGNTAVNVASSPLAASFFPAYQILPQSEPEYVISRPGIPEIRDRQRLRALSQVNLSHGIREHKVVLFATPKTLGLLENVVSKLNNGISKGAFTFSLPTRFGLRLSISDKFVADNFGQYDVETDKFLQSSEERHQEALALIYLPPRSDLYYTVKAKLAHYGRVSQVLSTPSLDIYAAWNLATNIFAKLGYTPWAISEDPKRPNADIVLGFAYSSLRNEGRLRRNIGYVNVFDKNGIWRFVQSSSSYLDFEKRLTEIPQLIRNAIMGYLAGKTYPKIIDIHYTKRFSFKERNKTFEVIQNLVPDIHEVNFISLDRSHPLRVFDWAHPNLNFARGGILQLTRNEFLLSVAGELKSESRASRILKVRVWREPLQGPELDLEALGYRILAMTKLNWRSAVRETAEPVTLKYAEEIARLTNHFTLTQWNTVNNQLARVPWFL